MTKIASIEMPDFIVPAPFTQRPFAGIHNPFPYGCSILCNHPTDFEAKAIVQRAKDTWVAEGKSLVDYEEQIEHLKRKEIIRTEMDSREEVGRENIFGGLTAESNGICSRPPTPPPTTVSSTPAAVKVSLNLRNRRCLTPDPASFIPTKEKRFLVLDLRRSHSQEIVSCQREHVADIDVGLNVIEDENASRPGSPETRIVPEGKKKKTPRKKSVPTSGASSISSPTKGSPPVGQEKEKKGKSRPESPRSGSDSGEEIVVKRRGRKRRGKKSGKERSKEGDKEFKGIPDPGETQVSAMGNDSKEGSSRQSLCGDEVASENRDAMTSGQTCKPKFEPDEESFLGSEILRQLQRQLDQEVVDLEMNVKRKKALEEAMRHKSSSKFVRLGEEMKMLKLKFEQFDKNESEKWMSIPRVFKRKSVRFELPMDSRLLNEMTPLEYVQKYAFPSSARLVLYNHVFNLCKQNVEEDDEYGEEPERLISGEKVIEGLGKIMGRTITEKEGEYFRGLLGWSNEANLNFRTFAGIAAACERLMGPKFCSKMPGQKEDPRHAIETADFEKLESKLNRLRPDRRLVEILRSLRDF